MPKMTADSLALGALLIMPSYFDLEQPYDNINDHN
jgi:hypothetical protein